MRKLLNETAENGLNSPCCLNRLARATACAGAARPPWCRPRHQRRRCPAPTVDTVRTPGTFGISAWLHRSAAQRHQRCRGERIDRDPLRDRRHSYASPCLRGLVAAGEGLGSCYSSGHATFPPRVARRGPGVVAPWLPRISRGWVPAITANAHLCPPLPVLADPLLAATRTRSAGWAVRRDQGAGKAAMTYLHRVTAYGRGAG